MNAHGFLDLLTALGVDRSHSRPRVSNDNAYSESHFETLKYQPDYPGRFRDAETARAWCDEFFDRYNHRYQHSGLALFTPGERADKVMVWTPLLETASCVPKWKCVVST